MNSARFRTGLHRVGAVLGVVATLPALNGLWALTQGNLDPDGWKLILAFLALGIGVYALFWAVAWIIGGFAGDKD
jgi:hypothetical protein